MDNSIGRPHRWWGRWAALLAALVSIWLGRVEVTTGVASAQEAGPTDGSDDPMVDPDTEVAKRHHEAGVKLYKAKAYEKALVEFEAGRRAKSKSQFDFNIARCLDRLERWEEAVREYEKYLAANPADQDGVTEAKERVRVLRERLALPPPTKAEPQPATPPVAQPPPAPPRQPTAQEQKLATAVKAAATPEETPYLRRPRLYVPAAVTFVAAVVGIAAGVAALSTCPQSGCLTVELHNRALLWAHVSTGGLAVAAVGALVFGTQLFFKPPGAPWWQKKGEAK